MFLFTLDTVVGVAGAWWDVTRGTYQTGSTGVAFGTGRSNGGKGNLQHSAVSRMGASALLINKCQSFWLLVNRSVFVFDDEDWWKSSFGFNKALNRQSIIITKVNRSGSFCLLLRLIGKLQKESMLRYYKILLQIFEWKM